MNYLYTEILFSLTFKVFVFLLLDNVCVHVHFLDVMFLFHAFISENVIVSIATFQKKFIVKITWLLRVAREYNN